MYRHSFIRIFLSLAQSNCWTRNVSFFTGKSTEVSTSPFCLLNSESGSAHGPFMMSQITLTHQHNGAQSQIRFSVRVEEICTFSTKCENSLIMSSCTSIILHAEAPTFRWRNKKGKHLGVKERFEEKGSECLFHKANALTAHTENHDDESVQKMMSGRPSWNHP